MNEVPPSRIAILSLRLQKGAQEMKARGVRDEAIVFTLSRSKAFEVKADERVGAKGAGSAARVGCVFYAFFSVLGHHLIRSF